MLARSVTDTEIRAVLAQIHDPCSVAAGRPLSVVAMGMVRGWTLDEGGTLTVTFCVTFAGCTMAPHFTEAARAALAKLPGIERVETLVDTAYAWTPDDMQAAPVPMQGEPQAWRRRAASAAVS